ncbi:MAG: sulfotransferase family protein [Bacteroidales bacterium]
MGEFRRSPGWFRAINVGWKGSYFLGTKIRLEKDELIRAARKTTGLHDLGIDFNDEPLERLLKSANEEAGLHPIGRFITRERFVSLLSIRLRAEYFFKKYPQILGQELYPAWIIVGLQRTGTTKLQRLLAEDPDHRFIPSWEVINPVPMNLDLYDLSPAHPLTSLPVYPHPKDKRISIANTSVKALRLMSPGFFAIHPIDAMQPEEDILMLDVSFMSTTPEAMMHVPSYASWLEQTDQSLAYAYAVKLLKFMQWIKPAKRWILKTPHHLEFPDLIEKHFGEVHFLWPHRNLQESIPSFLSMVTYNRMIFSNHVDERKVADHWVRKIGYMLDKAVAYRVPGNHDAKFTDFNYRDFITDAIPELEKIYRLNGGLTPELIERFRRHELKHPHQKHGVHQYSMADFGITQADIELHTSNYTKLLSGKYERKQT